VELRGGGADVTGTYDVSVLLRPGPLPTTGTIDVTFYLVSTTLRAANAATDAGLARMVSTFSSIYARAGLCVGTVTFVDVVDWARAKYATGVDATRTGPCDPLSQLLTLAENDDAIHLFLVDDLHQAGGTGLTVLGVDGAVPGPSSFGGTIVSGAVVNAADMEAGTCGGTVDYAHCGADGVAQVVAHETGHWLGLYHTTEKAGTIFDPLADSATCACAQCAPAADRANCGTSAISMASSYCSAGAACGGGDNLMFWLVGGDALTSQQSQVMLASPAAR